MQMASTGARVIVSTYEELPPRCRRRPTGHGAPTAAAAAARAKASSTVLPRRAAGGGGGGYSRGALLLAYAQQLRRRCGGGQQRGPPLLGWGEWAADPVVGGGNAVVRRAGRRSWCARLRSCARLWIRTFLRRVRRIRENASCKKGGDQAGAKSI